MTRSTVSGGSKPLTMTLFGSECSSVHTDLIARRWKCFESGTSIHEITKQQLPKKRSKTWKDSRLGVLLAEAWTRVTVLFCDDTHF